MREIFSARGKVSDRYCLILDSDGISVSATSVTMHLLTYVWSIKRKIRNFQLSDELFLRKVGHRFSQGLEYNSLARRSTTFPHASFRSAFTEFIVHRSSCHSFNIHTHVHICTCLTEFRASRFEDPTWTCVSFVTVLIYIASELFNRWIENRCFE